MRNLFILLVSACVFAFNINAQNGQAIPPPPCNANDNSGFGGAVGLNRFLRVGDETAVTFAVSLINGGDFNDVFVIYIANGNPGRSVIDNTIEDDEDAHRIAISNSNAYGYGSTITFPSGFEATHAIAVDVNFGGLWSIPNTGNIGTGGLNFIKSVTSEIITPSQDTAYEISFDWTDIGLTGNDNFYYVGMYVSHEGYTSDEGYGDGIVPGTMGSDDVVFTGYREYQNDCNVTLATERLNKDFIKAYFIDDQLNIIGPHDVVSIKVFDITGRLLDKSKHQIPGKISIPMDLLKNQLQFIVVEGTSSRKVLKVIPN